MPQPRDARLEAGTRQWFRVQAKQGNTAEIFIYDEIGRGFFGGGVAAEDLVKEIKALKLGADDELKVRINSPGGQFFEGITIHNFLRTLKAKVNVRIDGVAASAASVVAMAGDRVEMPQNAMMFIHNPWMFAAGDARTMRKAADDLDQMAQSAIGTYLRKSGEKLARGELIKMLDAETWLSAEDSVKFGLADVVDEPVRAAALAQFDLSKYGFPVPSAIASAKNAITETKRRQREQLRLLVGQSTFNIAELLPNLKTP
jgi:ATP-dependent Clp protease protease subunit